MASEDKIQELEQTSDRLSIDIIQEYKPLTSVIIEKMETISISKCIFRVPEKFLSQNEKAFVPQRVFIGPFHRGSKETLKEMENHKWRYLHALLTRKPGLEASLDKCVTALRELEGRARKCYHVEIKLKSDDFVEMMLVDSCFIIELFLKYTFKDLRRRDDPIFRTNEVFFRMRCDLILLENQIPFLVLQHLFNIAPIPKQYSQYTLIQLAHRFFNVVLSSSAQVLEARKHMEGYHLLDLIHNCYLPTLPKFPSTGRERKGLISTTKLQEVGIKVRRSYSTESVLDIDFVNGVIKIPQLKINRYTEVLMSNLIALEHCYPNSPKQITSYAFLFSSLMDSVADMKLLHDQAVVNNLLSNMEEAVTLFKKLCKDVELEDFYYAGLCEQVEGHKRSKWHVRCQKLKHIITNLCGQLWFLSLGF